MLLSVQRPFAGKGLARWRFASPFIFLGWAMLLLLASAKIWAPASPWGWGFGIGLIPFVVVTTHELGRSMELAGIHFWWILFVGYVLELLCIIGLMLWWLLSLVGQGAVSLGQICGTGLQLSYAPRPIRIRIPDEFWAIWANFASVLH